MNDADHVGALVLSVLALILLAWGIRRHLRESSAPPAPTQRYLDEVERERRYHSSNQWGR